jgi:N-methylhydantoinase A
MSYIIGCDTGGTFTDVVVVDEKGKVTTAKALSTPPTFIEGITNSLSVAAELLELSLEQILKNASMFVLGTTIATNTVINRSGCRTGLITTVGHEHVHHIARGGLSKWSGLSESETREAYRTKKVDPLVPKRLAKGVVERIDWKGSVVCKLDTNSVNQAIKELVDEGVDAIAVCLLWSFYNPEHEREIDKILNDNYPQVYRSISHQLEPALGEYARSNTTIIDSYVGPETKRYLEAVDKMLSSKGFNHPLLVMQAHGGSTYGRDARPYATLGSGPAAGVVAARYLGELTGHKNIISADVGGTSFDVSLIANGELGYAREPVVARFPVSFPMVDVISIGAGGGSIAWIDPLTNRLRVGPVSAGSNPGPACYGFGGTEPTVTDADLMLGYLNPDYFLGGKAKLYPDKARTAIKKIGDQLNWGVTETASAIYEIVSAQMADLVRNVTVERGYSPSDFALMAFGGNGPLHAAVYGSDLGVKEVIVPPTASTLSAFGLATSDILHNHRIYHFARMPMDVDTFNKNFQLLEEQINKELERDGFKEQDRQLNYSLDMRWGSQYYSLRVPIERKKYVAEELEQIANKFADMYENLYGKGSAYTPSGIFITSFVIDGIGKIIKPSLPKFEIKGTDPGKALKGQRDAYFKKFKAFTPTNIYDFAKLEPGNVVMGPAIIEATQTTIVIPPDRKASLDAYLNVIIK